MITISDNRKIKIFHTNIFSKFTAQITIINLFCIFHYYNVTTKNTSFEKCQLSCLILTVQLYF